MNKNKKTIIIVSVFIIFTALFYIGSMNFFPRTYKATNLKSKATSNSWTLSFEKLDGEFIHSIKYKDGHKDGIRSPSIIRVSSSVEEGKVKLQLNQHNDLTVDIPLGEREINLDKEYFWEGKLNLVVIGEEAINGKIVFTWE